MIKVKNNIATREPIPYFLVGLDIQSLSNLAWTDPSLGVCDCAWWPEIDQSPALGRYERYGAESLTVDAKNKRVIVIREVLPFSAAEIEALHLQAQTAAFAALANQYDTRVQALAAGYSQYERESWPVQTAEATAYATDPQTATPWLDAASAARGIDKAELAVRVIAMDTAYRQIHGALTGHRQKLWEQINAAQTTDDIGSIDVTSGWPT